MQQYFDFPISPAFSFDGFVTCDGNAAALQFARRIADPADPEKLLYLHGPSGSGKTHLLHAVAGAVSDTVPVTCLTCRADLDAGVLLGHFGTAGALLVDDLHRLPDDPELRSALWQVFNDFYIAGRPIVMTGLCPPRELPHLDEHLVSRLLWGLVARVDASDDDSRRMILRKVAADRQVRVPDEVMNYIVMTASREVGALIASFDALYRLSLAEQRKISLALARECRERCGAGDMLP